MKKKIIINIILWLISLGIMLLIFFFSSDNGTESSIKSNFIVNVIFKVIKPLISNEEKALNVLSVIVRKTAHFSIYALLALSLYFSLKYTFKPWWIFMLNLPICFIYAIFDEFHQSFVDGRNGNFIDCIIDTLGAFLVFSICLLVNLKRRDKYGN